MPSLPRFMPLSPLKLPPLNPVAACYSNSYQLTRFTVRPECNQYAIAAPA